MDLDDATASFAALAQETRLRTLRMLIQHEPQGLPAGAIARALAVPHNTLSAHLAVLSRASWVTAQRQGRNITYRANLPHVQSTVDFLVHDCCAGHPEVCTPILSSSSDCCSKSATGPEAA